MVAIDMPSGTRPKSRRSTANRVKTGCWTCRARRLRCDEQKPKCIRCTKVNLVCNGLGFAGGIHASRPAVVKISESTVPMIPVNSPQLHSSRAVRDILDLLPAMFGEMKKVDAVNPLTKAIRIQGVVFCSYLEYLPPTAGYNMALDSTTKCVSSALRDYVRYTSSTSGKVTAVPWGTKTLLLYTSALKHLASGLNDEVQSVSIEVLCATILLQSLEAIYDQTAAGTINHANGALHLIKHRGTKRFTTDFEKGLLAAQLPNMMMRARFNNTPIVLDMHYWRPVLKSCISAHRPYAELHHILIDSALVTAPVLNVFASTTALLTNQLQSNPDKYRQRIELLHQVHNTHVDVLECNIHGSLRDTEIPLLPSESWAKDDDGKNFPEDWSLKLNFGLVNRANSLLLSRLAIVLGVTNADQIESHVQHSAAELLKIYNQVDPLQIYAVTALIVERFLHAIFVTADEWRRLTENSAGRLIELPVYCRWLKAMGVQSPEDPITDSGLEAKARQ